MELKSSLLAATLLLATALPGAASPTPETTGRAVYQKVCIACHAAENVMVAAPKLGDKAEWARRLAAAGGIGTLTDHAVDGFAAMPPKGGAPQLSRAEVRSAIEYMTAPLLKTTPAR